jgi:predicted XRE-type DNA-binding protein
MIEFEGEHDHVHLLVNYPPKVAIARLVNSVVYLRANNMSQVELAKKLGIEPARLNEIVKYRVELFTLDRLIGYVEKLNPDVEVTVA